TPYLGPRRPPGSPQDRRRPSARGGARGPAMSASLRSRPQSAAGTPSSPRSHPTTAEAPSSPRSRPWTSAGSRGRKRGSPRSRPWTTAARSRRGAAATGWTSARDAPEPHDPLAGASGEQLRAAVRCAVRLELVAFFGEQAARMGGPQRPSVAPDFVQSQTVWDELTDDGSGDASKSLHAQHFTKFTQADHKVHGLSHGSTYSDLGQSQPICQPNLSSQGATLTAAASFAKRLWLKDEPERSGPLAALVRSRFFERTIQAVILTNCLVMGLSANYEMNHAPTFSDEDFGHNIFTTLDIIFQVFYTLELILKLAVHREFFFWNQDAGLNTFDLFLVISGYVDLLFANGGGGSTALRAVRVLKLGKALRALKVVKGFRILRAILVCIQASFVTLLWSVIMLCLVFYVFSLIFVQQAASRLEDIGDRDDPVSIVILDNFKSVQTSMVTLAKAAFGGEDWGVALDVVAECGFMSALFYMLFIPLLADRVDQHHYRHIRRERNAEFGPEQRTIGHTIRR
ncbi:unnamed protein product, partial [Prorocentrum cordatum]